MKTALAILSAVTILSGVGWASDTNEPPVILRQPQSLSVREGEYAWFEVVARGAEPIGYTWTKNGTNTLVNKTPLIQFRLPTTNDAGLYQVVVTNEFGAATSAVARLDVRPFTARELRVSGFKTNAAGEVILPIDLKAQGDENRVSGSIRFSTNVLKNARLATGPALANATLTLDTGMSDDGLLGISVSMPSGSSVPAGVTRLAELAFDVATGASVLEAAVAWTNLPVAIVAQSSSASNLLVEPVVVPALVVPTDPPALDPQSGLFLHTLKLLNHGGDINGVSIVITGLTNDSLGKPIVIKTALTDTNGAQRVEYGPILAGVSVDPQIEYYVADRRTIPSPQFEVEVRQPSWPVQYDTFVVLDRCLYTNNVFMVEWETGVNVLYYVQYTSQVANTNAGWRTSLPPVIGNGRRVQWIDRGPPRTDSPPTGQERYYRVFWR
ncbi:MAG TPA: immunoglobulin domain-containing protein [Verrucomicrobiota bacterium]|nr:immunoglobulin domain-containing protein [Verrucomicrobiota bacterium]